MLKDLFSIFSRKDDITTDKYDIILGKFIDGENDLYNTRYLFHKGVVIGSYSEYGNYGDGYVVSIGNDPDIQKILDKWLIQKKLKKEIELQKMKKKSEEMIQKQVIIARKALKIDDN